MQPSDLEAPEMVIQIGLPPRRIDVLTDVTGLEFGAAWAARVVHAIDALDVPFISRDDLVRNERATGRYKTWATSRRLERIPAERTDGAYVIGCRA